jgi:hypothetical protein
MNTRWTLEEEKRLIKAVKHGNDLSSLAKELDRSENALELRVKKIIYDTIAANKSISSISRNLNLSEDKIRQYFYSYKDMMDKKGKSTIDINENNKEEANEKEDRNVLSQLGRETQHKKSHKSNSHKTNKVHDTSNLEKIKLQNEKIGIILKNIELKHELKKAIKDNKLDKKEIEILRDIFKKK